MELLKKHSLLATLVAATACLGVGAVSGDATGGVIAGLAGGGSAGVLSGRQSLTTELTGWDTVVATAPTLIASAAAYLIGGPASVFLGAVGGPLASVLNAWLRGRDEIACDAAQ